MRSTCTNRIFLTTVSVAGLVSAMPAWAQSTGQASTSTTSASAPAETTQPDAGDIIVTGSRIQRNGYQTPTPVTALTSDALSERAPSNLPDAINQLPQFLGSQSPASRQRITVNTQVQVGNFLNLRGLGPQRTLILFDGVRVPPTSADGSVSIDTLPQTLVQRVDVVTGGASAVYGSDAVVGVVNFVLDKNFTGIKASGQYGISNYGDAQSYKGTLAVGVSLLDDRLHLLGSVERYSSVGIKRFDDRPLAAAGLNYCTVGAGTAASPFSLLSGCHSQIASYGGLIRSGPLAGNEFLNNGTIAPFAAGGTGGVGGTGSVLPTSQVLQSPLETWQLFGRASFDFSPSVRAYVQVAWSEAINGPYGHGASINSAGTAQGLIIQSGNAFLNPAVQALLGPTDTFQLGRWADPNVATAIGKRDLPIPTTKQSSESLLVSAGFSGNFANNWKWDVNYVHGETKFDSATHEVNMLRMFAAVDAVRDGTGNIVCRVTLTNPTLYPGCVAFNPFGVGNASDAAINYIFADSIWAVKNKMDSFSANLTGDLFSTWAGPVSFAVGGEYRKQSLLQTSNADPGIPIDLTGLRGAPASNAVRFNTVNVGSASGKVEVKEGYAEVVVPLARDIPFLHSLDVSGAVRYTDYSTSGGVTTWKAGVDWSPFRDLRIRATRSRDIRAPSLYDLFAGTQQTLRVTLDTHVVPSISQPVLTVTAGNTALTPEIGNTLTYGFVYQPSWLPGFGISVDAYDITIANAITSIDPTLAIQACEDSGGTGPTCALVSRPLPFSDRSAANVVSSILSLPINAANLHQSGIDFEASYRFGGLGGEFEIRGLASYLSTYETDLGFNQALQQSAGYRNRPQWHGLISAAYRGSRLGVFVQERFTGSFNMATYFNERTKVDSQIFANNGQAPNYGYTDLTLTYKVLPKVAGEVFLTVNNLFDAGAPVLFPSGNNSVNLYYPTERLNYDIMGRYFTMGFRTKF